MKKILIYRWKAYNYLDIKSQFAQMGYEVDEIYMYLESYDVDERFESLLSEKIKTNTYEFVFTVNYFAIISKVCHDIGIPYISWSCDNPLISMYHESVFYDTNHIFLFDYINYNDFVAMGVKNVDYLPLCTNPDRMDAVINAAKDLDAYKNEICFVGSLYERNSYDKFEPELSEYLRGYLECFINLQSHMPSVSLIDTALTVDALTKLYEVFKLDKSEGSFSDIGLVFSTTALGFKVARTHRIEALNMLAQSHDVSIYSNSDTSVLSNVSYKGGLDYWGELPKAFYMSDINLNFTIPNIKSGIPLRMWDIMAARGFLITNKQPEISLFLKEDEEIVTYSSYKELHEKVNFYLKNESARKKIIDAAYKRIKKYHTYSVRMSEMFDALKGKL